MRLAARSPSPSSTFCQLFSQRISFIWTVLRLIFALDFAFYASGFVQNRASRHARTCCVVLVSPDTPSTYTSGEHAKIPASWARQQAMVILNRSANEQFSKKTKALAIGPEYHYVHRAMRCGWFQVTTGLPEPVIGWGAILVAHHPIQPASL